ADETEWTRANLVEVLPDMTSPQALAVFEKLLNRAEQQYMGKLMGPEDSLGPMLKSFFGRLYLNLAQIRYICAMTGVPAADMLKSMGHAEAIQPADEKAERPAIRQLLSSLPDFLRMMRCQFGVANVIREHDMRTRENLQELSPNPQRLSDKEIFSS